MLHDEVIICFTTSSWDYLWQRHQEIMLRFARNNNRVLYVEPIGIRMPKWEDRQRIVSRLRNRRRAGEGGIRLVAPNLWIVDPLVNPFQQIGLVHRRNVAALTRQLQRAWAQVQPTASVAAPQPPIIWSYTPTPLAREVSARLAPKLLVYDCVDAYSENPKGVFSWYAASEQAFSREADIVFVTSPTLLERQRPFNPNTFYMPAGVEYEKFADSSLPEPGALAEIGAPRLTFFGGIDERVDLGLVTQLAERHPTWQILMLGIVRTDVSALRQLPNVHFLGHIAHNELPGYLHHSNVILLPYRRTVFSRYIQPAKLFECLAVGKPVVGIGLPVFESYREVMYIGDGAVEFERLVHAALEEQNEPELVERRRACARANTWDARLKEINARMEEKLGV